MTIDYNPMIENVKRGVLKNFFEDTVDSLGDKVEAAIAKGEGIDDCRSRIVEQVVSDFPYCDGIDTSFCKGIYATITERLHRKLDCSPPSPEQMKNDIAEATKDFRSWDNELRKYMAVFKKEYDSRRQDFLDAHSSIRKKNASPADPQTRKAIDTEYHWMKAYLMHELPQYAGDVARIIDQSRNNHSVTDISQLDWRSFSPILFQVFAQQYIDGTSEQQIFLDYVDKREALRDKVLNQGLMRRLGLVGWRRKADTWRPGSASELPADDLVVSSIPLPPPTQDDANIKKMTVAPNIPKVQTVKYRSALKDLRAGSIHALALLRANRRQRISDATIGIIKAQGAEELYDATFNGIQTVVVSDSDVKSVA